MASTSTNDNDKLLTMRILETPAGQEVLGAFFNEMLITKDIPKSVDKAKEVAQGNGTLVPLQITLVADFLIRVVGPPIIKQLYSSKRK